MSSHVFLNHFMQFAPMIAQVALRDTAVAVTDASLFGVPYVGTAIPIFDPESREVIGSLFIGESTENQELLKNMSRELSDHVSEISTFTKDIAMKAEAVVSIENMAGEIMKDSGEIKDESGTMRHLSEEITGILGGLSQNIESIYGMVEELYSLSEAM